LAERVGFFRTAAQVNAAREAEREYDRRRTRESATRRLYWTREWRAIAADQLRIEPLCRMCRDEGVLTPATICDHVIPHRGDVHAFWSNERQSLCRAHHSGQKQAEERAAGRKGGGSKV
jgi:5-methylcytosine-specific restriction endonuclease McrA